MKICSKCNEQISMHERNGMEIKQEESNREKLIWKQIPQNEQ
jgi:hypothetical protein